MTERKEDTPSYRLGVAIAHIRVLLGDFGTPDIHDRNNARAFLESEDARTAAVLAGKDYICG